MSCGVLLPTHEIFESPLLVCSEIAALELQA